MDDVIKKSGTDRDADVVTEIQDHIALICNRFFNFVGALQRDAPPAPLHIAAAQDEKKNDIDDQIIIMRTEISESLKKLELLIEELPEGLSTQEDAHVSSAMELEAAVTKETIALREELENAQKRLMNLYKAHEALAEAALKQ